MKVKGIRCDNYKKHMQEFQEHPDRQSAPLFIRSTIAEANGWQKLANGWLCPECVRAAGNWALRGDMI